MPIDQPATGFPVLYCSDALNLEQLTILDNIIQQHDHARTPIKLESLHLRLHRPMHSLTAFFSTCDLELMTQVIKWSDYCFTLEPEDFLCR